MMNIDVNIGLNIVRGLWSRRSRVWSEISPPKNMPHFLLVRA